MSTSLALAHLLNFVLPAVFVGAVLALWARRYTRRAWLGMWLLNSLAGVIAWCACVLWLGVDGKMLAYAALLLACVGAQTLMCVGRK